MEKLVRSIGQEVQATIMLTMASVAFRKTYRSVFTLLIKKGYTLEKAMDGALKVAEQENDKSVCLSEEAGKRMLRLSKEIASALK